MRVLDSRNDIFYFLPPAEHHSEAHPSVLSAKGRSRSCMEDLGAAFLLAYFFRLTVNSKARMYGTHSSEGLAQRPLKPEGA